MDLSHFKTISVIGKGSYAKVLLVKHITTNTLYALKVLKKKQIQQNNQTQNVLTERQILIKIKKHPFLIKMEGCF